MLRRWILARIAVAAWAAALLAVPAAALDNAADVRYDGDINPLVLPRSESYNNHGSVTAIGGSAWGLHGITVEGGPDATSFANIGTLTAHGGSGQNSYGVRVRLGTFANHGTVIAQGGSGEAAHGLHHFNNFNNYGTVIARGSATVNGGVGIVVEAGKFTNFGRMTAEGGAFGYGVDVSHFENRGAATAKGTAAGVYGLNVFGGSFVNRGLLTLIGDGATSAVRWQAPSNNNTFMLISDSTLALAGTGARINLNNRPQALVIESGAKLISLDAVALAAGQTHDHGIFMENIAAVNQGQHFALADTQTLRYNYIHGGDTQSLTVTRVADASAMMSGNAATLFRNIESMTRGRTLNELLADPLYPYAILLANADAAPSAGNFGAQAAKEISPQGTANLVAGFGRTSILTGDIFAESLATASGIVDATTALTAMSASSGSAYANFSPDCRRSLYFWGKPLAYHGKLDGKSGYSTLTEDLGGGSIGFAFRRDRLVLGLSAHAMTVDVDGGNAYTADYTGVGANLGAAYRFGTGFVSPLLSVSGGFTRYSLEQTRSAPTIAQILPGLAASGAASTPSAEAWNARVAASNPFAFGRFVVTPELGFDFAHVKLKGYTERSLSGDQALSWHVSADKYRSAQGYAAAKLSYQATEFIGLSLKGRYSHEFGDKRATLTATEVAGNLPFGWRVKGQNLGRASGMLGAGVNLRFNDRVGVNLDYGWHMAKKYNAHSLSAMLSVGF